MGMPLSTTTAQESQPAWISTLLICLLIAGLIWGLRKIVRAYRSPSHELWSARIILTIGLLLIALVLSSIVLILLDITPSPAASQVYSFGILSIPLLGMTWLITYDVEKRNARKRDQATTGEPQPRRPTLTGLLLVCLAWIIGWPLISVALLSVIQPTLFSTAGPSARDTVMGIMLAPVLLGLTLTYHRHTVRTYRADRELKAQLGPLPPVDATKDPWTALHTAWTAPLPHDQHPGKVLARAAGITLGTVAAAITLTLFIRATVSSTPSATPGTTNLITVFMAGLLTLAAVYVIAYLSDYFTGAREAIQHYRHRQPRNE